MEQETVISAQSHLCGANEIIVIDNLDECKSCSNVVVISYQ